MPFRRSRAERRARSCASATAISRTPIVEAFWGFGASAEQLKARVKFEDPELIQRAIDRKQTILLLAAHHGNWEWLLLAAGAYFPIPIDVVYQPQRIASLDEFLRDVRCRFGGKLIPRKEFVYELLSHAGEPRAYALIADQTPRKEDPKHWTRFLRQDTAFFVGADKIAKFLESPVYFVSMKRERRGHYVVRLDVLAEPPYEDIDDAIIVERYARCLERAILDSPADWLWLQKKWKYAKPAGRREDVPGRRSGTRSLVAAVLTESREAGACHSATVARYPPGTSTGSNRQRPGVVRRRSVAQAQRRLERDVELAKRRRQRVAGRLAHRFLARPQPQQRAPARVAGARPRASPARRGDMNLRADALDVELRGRHARCRRRCARPVVTPKMRHAARMRDVEVERAAPSTSGRPRRRAR